MVSLDIISEVLVLCTEEQWCVGDFGANPLPS